MQIPKQRRDLKLEEDVYVVRARPGHPHVLVNRGYRRVAIIDCPSAAIVRTIELPAEAEDFPIAGWAVSPDGAESYAFGRELTEFAIRIDHEEGACAVVPLSSAMSFPLRGFAWFAPELRILDAKGAGFRLGDAGFEPLGARETKAATKELKKRIDDLDAMAVLRMADAGRGVYLFGQDKLGYASIDGKTRLLVPHDGSPGDVARLGDRLFVCFEGFVEETQGDEQDALVEASAGEHFVAIEAHEHAGQGHVVVVAGAEDSTYSRLLFFGD